jgi:hypothetical protein
MVVGFVWGLEPPVALAQLGFALFGETWPFLPFMKRAFKIAHERWGEEMRKSVGAKDG